MFLRVVWAKMNISGTIIPTVVRQNQVKQIISKIWSNRPKKDPNVAVDS